MNETELKHIIALLLEDARQVYQLSPNSSTLGRIRMAEAALIQENENSTSEVSANGENEAIEINSNISDSCVAYSHQIIRVSARIMEVMASELEKHNIKPTDCCLRTVMDVIYYSMFRSR
ncbi:hypothetical protein [Escherichia coli]|uniref:hypothetical protein n=1 Tax=Escherichia coli TaxID=562 RepID=UPI0004DB0951|nr:hypothetical protein [Escherichia coli]EFZ1785016.1 hypothetical protein [Shigella sonnei]EEW8345094.1 hypothetical protein [Escherichia coli]EFD9271618.1 hypothetical protein [Escherichia coli]EFG2117105.1 hypothetical protein [Escherichia coli]EFH3191075.1 hypothetical protein [Escherichia coli]